MSRWIVLLRAVTPTGPNKVPMAALREALESAGLKRVVTLINTGNLVVDTRLGQATLERLVHDVIRREFGGDLAVLARTPAYFHDALQRNPFADVPRDRQYLTLLSSPPQPAALAALLAVDLSPHRIAVVDDRVYLHHEPAHKRRTPTNTYLERKLQLTATTRIVNTIARLVELAQD